MNPGAAIELLCGGPAWVQDGGRPGGLAAGIPPGGALVPEGLARANRAVGNALGEAALEVFGELVVAARGADLTIAWEGRAAVLPRDHVRRLSPRGPVTYLSVRGGLDVPVVLGGRGFLPAAGIGGGPGRPLRAGDRVMVGGRCGGDPPPPQEEPDPDSPTELDTAAPLRVVAGPDLGRFAEGALDDLAGQSWRIGQGDRVGTALLGRALARADGDRAPSTPMVRGAVQVPAGGLPVVLGPDHPTTGGYAVLAVLVAADQGAFAARPRGAEVRFRAVTLEEARVATAAWRRALGRSAGV